MQLYFVRLGFLDGLLGLQMCVLIAFFNTFVKQARLWELEHATPQPDPECAAVTEATPPSQTGTDQVAVQNASTEDRITEAAVNAS